jgi:preprotein translocase subunit SecA
MAGRGTDIMLGENVAELGGLHVIGTERHESRRIDNQLRGRSGRQGDPGSTQFYLSFEDDLMRRFIPDKMKAMISRAMSDGEPLEGNIFTKAIANAQKQVENNNFDARRWVLQYDDVLNQQREIIYKQRRQVLTSEKLDNVVLPMIKSEIERIVEVHTAGSDEEEWELDGILEYIHGNVLPEDRIDEDDLENKDQKELTEFLYEEAEKYYEERREELGDERMNEFSKVVVLRTVDRKWMDHIDAMEQLRQGIHLRAYGQDNPLRSYQFEGFAMFEAMVQEIQEEVVKYVMKAVVQEEETLTREDVSANATPISGGDTGEEKPKVVPMRRADKVGRNDPCPCGSGKKYKNCHYRK